MAERRPDTIACRFRRIAAARGSRPAVVEQGRVISYEELDARSSAVAAALVERGCSAGEHVAVSTTSPRIAVEAMLGILKAGATYMNVDTEAPPARVEALLAQARCRLIVGDGTVASVADGTTSAIDASAPDPALPDVTAPSPAYVCFTSGSTGGPKGVVVGHDSVLRLVASQPYLEVSASTVVASAGSLSFDATTFEIWAPLLSGGTVATIGKYELLSAADLSRALADRQVDVLFVTTAVFNLVSEQDPRAFSGLRTLLTGGERASPDAFSRVLGSGAPPGRLLHVYGPTEAVTFASWCHISEVEPDAESIPIGRPLADTTLQVIGLDGQPAPEGEVGEIVIGGAKLAVGYLDEPAATAAAFRPDPAGTGGARVYQTGDLGHWEQGLLHFDGRVDTQVKLRGHRVELEEVERQAARAAGVGECVVTLRTRGGERELIAHVSPTGVPAESALAALDRHLRQTLPIYMVPAAYVTHDRLPLTITGKIDRRALENGVGSG